MQCPKCDGKLVKKVIANIEVDVCTDCDGIWFDAGELKEVLDNEWGDFDFVDIGKGKSGKKLDKKKGACPRCLDGTMLEPRQYEGKKNLRVDICPKKHGIWLDGGEIYSLRKIKPTEVKDEIGFYLSLVKFSLSGEDLSSIDS